jgi:hypothetical protein
MIKVETWLPAFPGFYNTLLESTYDYALENLNEDRAELGRAPLDGCDLEWDEDAYKLEVCHASTEHIEGLLKGLGFVESIKFQELISPREYNYTNDAINVEVTLTKANKKAIREHIDEDMSCFEEYLKDTYKSRSGFISSYSCKTGDWLGDFDETLNDVHKLGSVLAFCLLDHFDLAAFVEDATSDCYVQLVDYKECLNRA